MIEQPIIDLLQSLLVVEVILMALTVFLVYLIIRLPATYRIKFVAIPILIFGIFFTLQTFRSVLGYPVPEPLPERFVFNSYRVVNVGQKKKIEVWIIVNGQSRLHVIPYSRNAEAQMSQAMQRMNATGMPQVGHVKQPTDHFRYNEFSDHFIDLHIETIPYQDISPKQ